MVQIVAFCALGALDAFHARKLVCDRKILSPGFTSHVYPKIHMNESSAFLQLVLHTVLFSFFSIMETDEQIHYQSSTFFRPAPIIPRKASKCSHESLCTQQQILPLVAKQHKGSVRGCCCFFTQLWRCMCSSSSELIGC